MFIVVSININFNSEIRFVLLNGYHTIVSLDTTVKRYCCR